MVATLSGQINKCTSVYTRSIENINARISLTQIIARWQKFTEVFAGYLVDVVLGEFLP